ncbi:MAG: chitobiase/beta-hexosaminidase C-terminal domain-containing protein [Verrucomicrobiales bacterium]
MAFALGALLLGTGHATNAAYVHILKNETGDTRFHLSELEAFSNGSVPNDAGGASFDGMSTSTNDITAAGTYGDGNTYPTIGTTSSLEHGGGNRLPNNVLENVGNVWSTANGIGSNAQYTLDLGGVHDVTTIRMWPRADGCCSHRWRNLEIQLLDENRNPIPGTKKLHTTDVGNVALEFTFPDASSINSFSASPDTIASNEAVTLSWNIDPSASAASINQGVGDVLPLTAAGVGSILLDPGPPGTTEYTLSVTSGGTQSTAQATVTIDNDPIIHAFGGSQTTVTPGTDVTLTWDVSNFDELQLNGSLIEGGASSIVVTPLTTSTYTLTATNAQGSATADLTIIVNDIPDLIGANARFVEIVKNDINDTQLHISEIEVFQFGVTPDGADPDGTSGNDLVQAVNPSVETPPTTTSLEHGSATSVFDGDLESGGEVWTTQAGLGTQARYMLDLGTTNTINTVRVFGRADTCCLGRLQNFTVNLYGDDGSGNRGELVSSVIFPGVAPAGNVGHVELSLAIPDPGIRSFTVDKTFIPTGEPLNFAWEVNADSTNVSISGVGDVTAMTDAGGVGSILVDPGPVADTTYTLTAVRPNGTSTAQVSVEVTDQPLIFAFETAAGIVSPGTPVALTWDVANVTALDLNGSDVTGLGGTSVMPASSTTYTLTASNPNGSISREVRVRVALPGEPTISEFLADNEGGLRDEDGEPSDWIELCNSTVSPAALDGYFLTDDPTALTKWRIPDVSIAPGGYLLIFASGKDRSSAGSELHTNFSLTSSGEYLALVKPDGTTVVTEFSPGYPNQREDVSYGFDDEALIEGYFLNPTPGTENAGGFTNFVADTSFSVDRGFYDAPIAVEITSATEGAEIRYTVNGSKPTSNTGLVYSGPVAISQTTVLRAAAFKAGHVATNVDTHTYIFPTDVIANPNMRTSVTQHPTYGPQMVDALKAVPTISLVFQGDVDRTEKEASVELINFEAGDTQVDAGMERFGNYVTNFSKRGMRLNFRKLYGPGKLEFPVFDGHEYPIPPADQVDSIDLRSGNHDMSSRGAYMSNRFTDDTMLDMGNIAPHGRFVHVYLNGLYWGQYHMRERWSAAMMSEYYGGTKADYESINANNAGNEFLVGTPSDGTGEYWAETRDRVNSATPFASASSHIDMANVFNFMMLWVSGSSESEFRSAGSIPLGVPYKFFMKDADGFLRSSGRNLTHNGPLNVMSRLASEADPDYKTLLADEIHRHYFNDGAFTPARNIARLQARVDEIELSFLAESARWGERTPESWRSYQDNLINNHFPGLTNTMIGRFTSGGFYPSVVAPSFSQHGGSVPPGFQLAVTAPAGTIYYTLDGSDPRVSAEPVEVDPPVTIVAESAPKTVHVPTGANDGFTDGGGNDWNDLGFDDSGWVAGSGGVGYERSSGYEDFIDIDVESSMWDKQSTCLIRIPFDIAAGALAEKSGASIRVRYDDAYVAYLNGTEIARRNFNGSPAWDSVGSSHSDGAAVILESVDISAHFDLLNDGGANVLAFHGMNSGDGSSDFLISAELRVSEVPAGGGNGGAISPTAIPYTGTIPIDTTTMVRARVLDASGWSAINESTFVQEQDLLVVSEIMYNPSPSTAAEIAAGHGDSEDFEFLELLNTGSTELDLFGVRFQDGITFDFSLGAITSLGAGQRLVIVEDLEAFEFRYGAGLPVAGTYSGKLKDEGENLQLVDGLGEVIREFTYDNAAPWPLAAAGQGSSLVLIDPDTVPDHSDPGSWIAGLPGGTPGAGEIAGQSFSDWAAANGVGDPNGDDDFDNLENFLEFFMGGDPSSSSPGLVPEASVVDGHLSLTFQMSLSAGGVVAEVETSSDLITWTGGASAELVTSTNNGDGTASLTYRSVAPIDGAEEMFIRLRVSNN